MNSWTKSVLAWALIAMPALGADVAIYQIAKKGDPVPGRAAGITFWGNSSSLPGSINEAGEIVFQADSASAGNSNSNTASGIYVKRPLEGSLRRVADTTGAFSVPGHPLATWTRIKETPIVNNAGDIVFVARYSDPTIGSKFGIFATTTMGGFGDIVKVVDETDIVPGNAVNFNGFISGSPDFAGRTLASLNDAGQVVFYGTFFQAGTTRHGLFGGSISGSATVRIADSTNTVVPAGQASAFTFVNIPAAISASGAVVFSGRIGTSSSVGGLFTASVTGGSVTPLALRGQDAPASGGLDFGNTFNDQDLNELGAVAFDNQLAATEWGLYGTDLAGSSPTLVAHTLGAPFRFVRFATINESAQMGLLGVDESGFHGIYRAQIGGASPLPVAVHGDVPPGLTAPAVLETFENFSGDGGGSAAINDDGNLLFNAKGDTAGGGSLIGLYFYDFCGDDLIRIVDSESSSNALPAGLGGSFSGTGALFAWQYRDVRSGHAKSINNANQVTFLAQFNPTDFGIYLAQITNVGGGGQLNVTCPPDAVVECPGSTDPSATGEATASGCGTIAVSHADVTTAGCGATSTIARTWTASNGSTTASCVQTITVGDTADPILVGVPDNANVQCNGFPLPPPPTVTASDACQGSIIVILSESQVAGTCPGTYILTRTWTATDGCGNSVIASQDTAVMDSLDPVLVGVPGDVPVECDAVPGVAEVTASDDCATSIPVYFVEASVSGDCPDAYTLTRSWTAADDCGNDVTATQYVSVDDTTPPSITCPPHASLECPAADTSVAANGSASGLDNCGDVTIAMSEGSEAGCGQTQTITRSWIASDECGNSAPCDQLVSVVDTTPPMITVDTLPITAADIDCSGSESVTLPTATASDACDGPVAVNNDAPASFPAGSTTVTYSASDACTNTATTQVAVNVLYGANIHVEVASHEVGSGTHPGSTKTPLANLTVCAYDKAEGSCPRTVCGGISHQHYQCILDDCSPVNCCITDSNGECTINLPPGDYIVVSGEATKTVLPDPLGVSASDLACGQTMQKHLQQIVKVNGQKTPAKTTRLTGSELLIIEPEYVIWDDTVQYYPFVFETIGDWTVTATVAPPEGFVADYPALTTQVDNELEAVQFTIEEVGSDLVPTVTTFDVIHNGKRKEVRSAVDILLTPDYAKSRGFNVDELRVKGIIVEPTRNEKATQRGAGAANR